MGKSWPDSMPGRASIRFSSRAMQSVRQGLVCTSCLIVCECSYTSALQRSRPPSYHLQGGWAHFSFASRISILEQSKLINLFLHSGTVFLTPIFVCKCSKYVSTNKLTRLSICVKDQKKTLKPIWQMRSVSCICRCWLIVTYDGALME